MVGGADCVMRVGDAWKVVELAMLLSFANENKPPRSPDQPGELARSTAARRIAKRAGLREAACAADTAAKVGEATLDGVAEKAPLEDGWLLEALINRGGM